MARSADTIWSASATGSEAATGGSGRGVAVGEGLGVAVTATMEGEGSGEMVGEASVSAGLPVEAVHAPTSSASAAEIASRLTKSLVRTPLRAREAGRARERSA